MNFKSVAVLGFTAAAIAFAAPANASTSAGNNTPTSTASVDTSPSAAGSTIPSTAPQNYGRYRFTSHRIVIRRAWIRTHYRFRLHTRLVRPAVVRYYSHRGVHLYPRIRYTTMRYYRGVRLLHVRSPRLIVRPQIRSVVFHGPRAPWRYNVVLNRRSG